MRRILSIGVGLAVVAFVGGVIVPNYLVARNRSRQRRTMADMRTIATAWEGCATVINSYSVGANHNTGVTTDELTRSLEPTYVRKFPRTDGWDAEFQFSTGDEGMTYVIRSFGSDGRLDRVAGLSGPTTDFSDDVVYSNGAFIRFPEGAG